VFNSGAYYTQQGATAGYHQQAVYNLFERAYQRGWWRRLIYKVMGRPHRLIALRSVCQCSATSHYAGIHEVELNRIIGSEGREDDFDNAFYPTNKHTYNRWIGIAKAREDMVPLPPVQLIQIGDAYYVRDGHHRISVAHARG
jgi:hypothetical protein